MSRSCTFGEIGASRHFGRVDDADVASCAARSRCRFPWCAASGSRRSACCSRPRAAARRTRCPLRFRLSASPFCALRALCRLCSCAERGLVFVLHRLDDLAELAAQLGVGRLRRRCALLIISGCRSPYRCASVRLLPLHVGELGLELLDVVVRQHGRDTCRSRPIASAAFSWLYSASLLMRSVFALVSAAFRSVSRWTTMFDALSATETVPFLSLYACSAASLASSALALLGQPLRRASRRRPSRR